MRVCVRERERARERVLGKEEGLGGREVRKRGEKRHIYVKQPFQREATVRVGVGVNVAVLA